MPLKMNELCIHSVFVALEEKVSQTKQNQVCFGWFFRRRNRTPVFTEKLIKLGMGSFILNSKHADWG